MHFRSQLSPISVDHESQSADGSSMPGSFTRPANWSDVKFFRSRLVYNTGDATDRERFQCSLNWSAVVGIGLATVFSAGVWFGVGVIVAQLLR